MNERYLATRYFLTLYLKPSGVRPLINGPQRIFSYPTSGVLGRIGGGVGIEDLKSDMDGAGRFVFVAFLFFDLSS